MSQAVFSFNERRITPQASVLDLQGGLDLSAEAVLRDAFARASQDGLHWLGLNFSRVSAMNSGGLTVLLKQAVCAWRSGQHLAAFGLAAHHRRVFELLGINDLIGLYSSETEALSGAGATPPLLPDDADSAPALAEGVWITDAESRPLTDLPAQCLELNVRGHTVTSAVGGFGQMWEKKYTLNLADVAVTPGQVVQYWKDHFGDLWPKGNHFYGPPGGFSPGDTAVLNLAGPGGITAPGGLPVIATGIRVIYADDTSFAFVPLQGHMLCGLITFSAFDAGGTTAQVHVLVRTSDPVFELSYWLGFGHSMEDTFWDKILRSLGAHFASRGVPRLEAGVADRRLQWREFGNLRRNAALSTAAYVALSPLRWIVRKLKQT